MSDGTSSGPRLEQRKEWIGKRFGAVDERVLGAFSELPTIVWPQLERTYERGGKRLRYCRISPISSWAERVAQIYRSAIDEMVGNDEYAWHHHADQIVEREATGDWAFYGVFVDGHLIGVESMHIIRGQRTLQWVWGCVDPLYRRLGAWEFIGSFNDELVEKSGAEMGLVWVATTHKFSQLTAESAGYFPVGCFVGGEFLGGSDGRYYRQSVIWYAKHYHHGPERIPPYESMVLTDRARRLVETVWSMRRDTEGHSPPTLAKPPKPSAP